MTLLKGFLLKALSFVGLRVTGLVGWLIQLLVTQIIQTIMEKYSAAKEEMNRVREIAKKDEKLLKEYENAVRHGHAITREERRKLAERLLNRDA